MYQLLKQNQKVIICNSFSIHDGKEATICGIANNLPECLMYIIELSDNDNEYSHIVMHADSLVVDDGIIDHDVEVFNMFNSIQNSDKFTVENAYEAFKDVEITKSVEDIVQECIDIAFKNGDDVDYLRDKDILKNICYKTMGE